MQNKDCGHGRGRRRRCHCLATWSIGIVVARPVAEAAAEALLAAKVVANSRKSLVSQKGSHRCIQPTYSRSTFQACSTSLRTTGGRDEAVGPVAEAVAEEEDGVAVGPVAEAVEDGVAVGPVTEAAIADAERNLFAAGPSVAALRRCTQSDVLYTTYTKPGFSTECPSPPCKATFCINEENSACPRRNAIASLQSAGAHSCVAQHEHALVALELVAEVIVVPAARRVAGDADLERVQPAHAAQGIFASG